MDYIVEQFVSRNGRKPVMEFILEQDEDTREWLLSGIRQLGLNNGMIRNQNLETKHIRNKIFELKFKKLAVRILFSYHPVKRKIILLLHGVVKKRDALKQSDISVAEERYSIVKESGLL